MAWENKIIGYKLKDFEYGDTIPPDAIFVTRKSGVQYMVGSNYPYEYFVYQVPVYKKVRTKKL